MRSCLTAALLVLAGAGACAKELANDDGRLVDKLRILAVKADPPEIGPGDHANLVPLVLDPKGEGRPLTYTWFACDPALDDFYGTVCSDGARLANLSRLAAEPSVRRLGTDARATYFAPPNLFYARDEDDPIRYFGVPAEVVLVVSAGSFEDAAAGRVEARVALVDVAVSEVPSNLANRNPSIAAVAVTRSHGALALAVSPGCDSVQSFLDVDPTNPDGFTTRAERLTASWFSPSGTLAVADGVSAAPGAACGDSPAVLHREATATLEGPATMAVVLRDSRGGVDFRLVPVAP